MAHHRRGLRRLLRDDALLARLEDDFETAGLDDRRLEMLRFARGLTLTPSATRAADVRRLRAAGWSDVDVLQLVEVVGYYAYANRIADGLGVALEEEPDS